MSQCRDVHVNANALRGQSYYNPLALEFCGLPNVVAENQIWIFCNCRMLSQPLSLLSSSSSAILKRVLLQLQLAYYII